MVRDLVISKIKKYQALGEEKLTDGTWLVGRVPHIGEKAWLQVICPPLEEAKAVATVDRLPLAEYYAKTVLMEMNGAHLFSGSLSLYGLRENPGSRSFQDAYKPFDIFMPNVKERSRFSWLGGKDLVIGFYDADGSRSVLRSDRTVGKYTLAGDCSTEWEDVENFIDSELSRLEPLFDSRGQLLKIL